MTLGEGDMVSNKRGREELSQKAWESLLWVVVAACALAQLIDSVR